MELKPYLRKAQFYETDKMGIIHHSNYIRWFEEARMDFLVKMNFPYSRMEKEGIGIPVLGINCEYKAPVRYEDEILIYPTITYYNGIKMTVQYHILNAATQKLLTIGESKHCFTNMDGRPVNVKKIIPELHELFLAQIEPEILT